jgi:biotin carboxyl carrier protein
MILGRRFNAGVADRMRVQIGDRTFEVDTAADGTVRVSGERTLSAWVASAEGVRWVFIDGSVYEIADQQTASAPKRRGTGQHSATSAPMPATVRKLLVTPGTVVKAGDVLIVLEAMKMELPVRAGAAGTVTAIHCREGELVQPGVPLIELADTQV